MNQKGVAPLLAITSVLVLIAVGFGGYYLGTRHVTPNPVQIASSPPSSTQNPDQVVCTADAKQCPDGSYVSRGGPNCNFKECPGTSTTTCGASPDDIKCKDGYGCYIPPGVIDGPGKCIKN